MAKKETKNELTITQPTTRQAMNILLDEAISGVFSFPFYSHTSFLPALFQRWGIKTERSNISTNYSDIANQIIELYDEYVQTTETDKNRIRIWETRNKLRQDARVSHLVQKLNKLEQQESKEQTVSVVFEDEIAEVKETEGNNNEN